MTERAAGAPDRLARQRLDARVRDAGRAPERALHDAGRAVPVDRARVGGPGRRADRRDPVRRPPRRPSCRSCARRFDWEHGVFLGATMSSEKTAAAAGTVGELRFDPFAMLPFCGYNMADYFGHWLEIGGARATPSCRRSSTSTGSARTTTGKFLWPGFGENSRVLAWIFRRCEGTRRGGRDADRPRAGAGRARPRRARPRRRGRSRSCCAVDEDAVRGELPQVERALRAVRRRACRGRCASSSRR